MSTEQKQSAGGAVSKPLFYCSWFCPFAQRAWIALEEKGVDYEYREVALYIDDDPSKKNPNKPADFMACNPNGTVPALEDSLINAGRKQGWPGLYESLVLVDYIDEVYTGNGRHLLPTDAYKRALVRIWTSQLSDALVAPFYQYLRGGLPDASKLDAGLKKLNDAMQLLSPQGGAFLGGDEISAFDIAFFPFAYRMATVLGHFRQYSFPATPEYARFNDWYKTVSARPAFVKTSPDPKRIAALYSSFATGKA